ncbi:MAG: ROK family protein [Miltoncostaeaceae bacterium]
MSVIGVDVGGTKIAAARLGPGDGIEESLVIPTPEGGEAVVRAIADATARLVAGATDDVAAVGVGVPATIDPATGIVGASNHTGLDGLHARDLLAQHIGLPVHVDNDGNLAALAEHRLGAARGHDDVVLMTVGTGIGGGLIIGGRVFRGGGGQGAELGHVVVEGDGPPCQGNCPNHGCIETMCSGTSLGRDLRAAAAADPGGALGVLLAEGRLDSRTGLDLARAGDADALGVFTTAGRWLGVAVASLTNIFDPGIVVIGGGLSAAEEILLAPAREEYQRRALPPTRRAPLVVARFRNDAGMVGAGILAAEEGAA